MANRRCRECGEVYDKSFQRCPACGAHGGRRIPRCKFCGSRLTGAKGGRCPFCGAKQRSWAWVGVLLRAMVVVLAGFALAATYVYSYVPSLGLPTPSWPTPTNTVTTTLTATAVPPTVTRTRTPTLTVVPPTLTKVPQVTYTIKSGDTLWGIADSFSISLQALLIANNLNDNSLIKEDQVLIIPKGTPTPPIAATPTAKPAAPVTRIAVPTSTPVPPTTPETRVVAPSSTPLLPAATKAAQVTYTIKSGDTLLAIADSFHISLEALLLANNLTVNSLLNIGQVLIIPDGALTPTSTPQP
jgi:LysM repeat protein/RNA polymerase subunit RPABC4/transcription elongation factor Spt4